MKISREKIDRAFIDKIDNLRAENATLKQQLEVAVEALKEANRTIDRGQSAIIDTVWSDGDPTTTLVDCIYSALAKIKELGGVE